MWSVKEKKGGNPASSTSGHFILCHRTRRKLWTFFAAAVCLMLLLGFQLADEEDAVDLSHYSYIFDNNGSEEGVCKIPVLVPWDESIRKYIQNAPPLDCRQVQPRLTFIENQLLYFNKTAFDLSGYSLSSVSCQKRCFRRGHDDNHNVYDEWGSFENGTRIECEFLEVDCRRNLAPLSIYNHLHAQVIPVEKKNSSSFEKFSVSLFVLDSVSQSHWKRGLTGTISILQNLYNATIMTGFNKVGDNSFPNAMAFLMGRKHATNRLPTEGGNSDFDKWPLIWKDFQKQGYSTFYAEDSPNFNLFNYLSVGFKKQPVDHYFRPYWLEAYSSFVRRRSNILCYNDKPMHVVQMDYYRDLVQKSNQTKPFFALHWLTELAHDWLSQVSSADLDIVKMLKEEEAQLQDTFLFMFSDHGHRFDPIRQTMIGRLEERMPFFSIHVPQNLLQRFPELTDILDWNSKQLASFYDLHVTLLDIIDLQERQAWSELRQRSQPIERFRKFDAFGLSLLRPLPAERTCSEAGIPDEYCICQTEKVFDIKEPVVQRAARKIVEHTNEILKPYNQKCAFLELKEIREARVSAPSQKVMKGRRSVRSRLFAKTAGEYDNGLSRGVQVNYAVMLEVEPSGAILEANIRHHFYDDSLHVVGDVNRLNRYGNQSICIQDAVARKYCYCT